ncbi:MAG: hypothetical protein NZ929_02240 [Aigarchaeota archaeon]|nr:hypothetical protein [Aigarchaeota archaeon]MCX8192979.1 hypothetical protein [Nitrososphaeria archaeon]MDW7986285.1 hypothetical protein [Nitrososphaerota archaeon]
MAEQSKRLRSIDTHFLSSVYHALRRNEHVEFKPRIRQDVGIVYDVFGVDVPEDKLKIYYDRGLIEIVGEVSFPSCPICGDTCLHIFLVCPECNSRNIEKKDLLIHYDCGYTDSVEEFRLSSEGVYHCPKCGKVMKRVGIDYGRPGFGFICRDCRTVFQVPLVEVECEKNHKNRVQQLEVRRCSVYRLSEKSKSLSQVFEQVEILAYELEKLGLDVVKFASLKGVSGVAYTIPVYVKGDPSLIIEIAPEEFIDERYPLLMSIEAVDIPNSVMIIILPSSFRPELESIFNPEKVKIIKVENLSNSIDKVVDEVIKIVGARILGEI